ncbi:DUF1322 family protein [Borrelia sp. P9F1]|uniref:DUF1322 family protein n=1 Tax=Borrelia sp. P9F1 TaxID=3058374 RepID=UPI002649C4F4|nr:DUF1322 family protein [Borrelia sp. P9F1]WKC58734.1 DUF1322 family protein [Borrelia sp. P9F1]
MNHNTTLNDYFSYLKYLRSQACKYYFPVLMGVCTYEDVRQFKYTELVEINKIANLKLKKETYERFLAKRACEVL